jgi:hypothetical protein
MFFWLKRLVSADILPASVEPDRTAKSRENAMQESAKKAYAEPTLEKREELVLVAEGAVNTIGARMMEIG